MAVVDLEFKELAELSVTVWDRQKAIEREFGKAADGEARRRLTAESSILAGIMLKLTAGMEGRPAPVNVVDLSERVQRLEAIVDGLQSREEAIILELRELKPGFCE